ncbi:MAG TPA: hypothetical protein VEA58_06375 [Anaerovoracaceae bacterium]|nr:hypothetical protein [Anaerovoracaceae bacterium]
MNTKEHLTQDIMKALKEGMLTKAETISALEHLGECEQCADEFAKIYSDQELLELSPGFKIAVFSAIKKEKRELYRYGFKVSVAACITLFLLFSGTFNFSMNFSKNMYSDLSGVNTITENLRGFSDKLIDFEVKNLKEEF